MWIRNPWWDGFWFLSGFPLALALVLVAAWSGLRLQNVFIFFAVVMTLDTIHRLTPMWTAWNHPGFRRVMVKKPMKYLAIPAALLAAGVAVGFASQVYWPADMFVLSGQTYWPADRYMASGGVTYVPRALSVNPLVWLMALHYMWNIWHFAMQNFGVMQIYRRRSDIAYPTSQRAIDRGLFLGIQIALGIQVLFSLPSTNWLTRYPPAIETNHVVYVLLGIAALAVVVREAAVSGKWCSPRILFAASQMIIMFTASGLWVVVISSFNHWLVAIGLSGHIDGNRRKGSPLPAVCGVSLLGMGLAFLLFFTPYLRANFFSVLLGFSAALGIVHFLYDRWLYKISDARVAATIGSDMFCLDAGHPR
jgi:hypothetical protein